MAEVASRTGGTAFEASSGRQLAEVYDRIQARVGYTVQPGDLTTWFVAAGVLALLAAAVAGLVWTGRFL
jgi:Ca-activated chloride channel family protein